MRVVFGDADVAHRQAALSRGLRVRADRCRLAGLFQAGLRVRVQVLLVTRDYLRSPEGVWFVAAFRVRLLARLGHQAFSRLRNQRA